MTVEIKKNYLYIRIKHPSNFIKHTFKTDDIGRKGHSYRVTAINKYSGKWETQAYRILKSDLKKEDYKAMVLLNDIADKHNMHLSLQRAFKKIKKGA